MSKGRNNFTNEKGKEKSKYKLWVVYDENSAIAKKIGKTQKYYGYMTKADFGLAKLQNLVKQRYAFIKVAIIYDNSTNTPIQRFDNPAFASTKNNAV